MIIGAVLAGLVAGPAIAFGADVVVKTDATWKATNPAPPAGWNTDVNFDDSGWSNAFKSPSGDNIWLTSNMSGSAPNQVWFRKVFTLNGPVSSAVGDFFFDDNGENYLNGHLIINDTGGGATSFNNVVIDPSFFVVGQNLFAIHGIDTVAPFNNVAANIQITVVPEPAAVGVLSAGMLVLLRRRGRGGRGRV
jgi:hypothetical protein